MLSSSVMTRTFLSAFIPCQIAIHLRDDAFVKQLDPWIGDQLPARLERDADLCSPVLQGSKGRGDNDGREVATIAEDGGFSDEAIGFQRVFDGLRRDELAARGLDQVLLAVGDEEEPLGIDSLAMSPVLNQSPSNAAAVSSGIFQ